mgnify:CR=1 FL=1
MPESKIIATIVTLSPNIEATAPKASITGSVPSPKAKSILAPSTALPVPAAMTYIACNGPQAITAAASSFIDLIVKESDNNIKLIVLDRLIELKNCAQHERVMQVCLLSLAQHRMN